MRFYRSVELRRLDLSVVCASASSSAIQCLHASSMQQIDTQNLFQSRWAAGKARKNCFGLNCVYLCYFQLSIPSPYHLPSITKLLVRPHTLSWLAGRRLYGISHIFVKISRCLEPSTLSASSSCPFVQDPSLCLPTSKRRFVLHQADEQNGHTHPFIRLRDEHVMVLRWSIINAVR